MTRLSITLIALAALTPAFADKKNEVHFNAGPADSYPSKETNDHVTVAAVPYYTEDLAHSAFGKLNPNQYDVLPILVVIQNDTSQALRLNQLELKYILPDRSRIDPTPAAQVRFAGPGPQRPSIVQNPLPIPRKNRKSPLDVPEIEGRSFSARMLPPHESASGFFYFQSRYYPGSRLYLTGINEAASGKDIYYFEIPLQE